MKVLMMGGAGCIGIDASGKRPPYKMVIRRPEDISPCYADLSLAIGELGWYVKGSLEQTYANAWRWQLHHTDTNSGVALPQAFSGPRS